MGFKINLTVFFTKPLGVKVKWENVTIYLLQMNLGLVSF